MLNDFANASDYEDNWNDSDSMTPVIARENNFLQHGNNTYIRCKKSGSTTTLSHQTQLSYGYKEANNEMF